MLKERAPGLPTASAAHRAALIGFALLGPLALDIYLPAVTEMGDQLGASAEEAAATLSIFFVGMAVGQLFVGPWSDRVGRRRPIFIGLLLLVTGSVICAAAPNITIMLLGRLVQALGGASVIVAGRAAVRDAMDERQSASFFSTIATVNSLAPILAPSLGGLLLLIAGWRGIFVFIALAALLVTAIAALGLPRLPRVQPTSSPLSAVRSYATLLRNRRFLGLFLAVAANGASYFTYLSLSPLVLMPYYGISPQLFGVLIGLNGAAIIIGAQVNRRLLRRLEPIEILSRAARVIPLIVIPLFVWAFTYWGGLAIMLALVFLVIATSSFVQSNGFALALSVSPERTGSAAALLGAGLFGSGTIASLIGGIAFDGTPRSMILVMAVSICLMLLALRFLVLKHPISSTDSDATDVAAVDHDQAK